MKLTALGSGDEPGRHELLDVYLNDHLAGATAGAEFIRRMVGEHRESAFAGELKTLAREISDDRQHLLRLMADLDMAVSHHKVYGAWLGEKIGRVKPNGRLLRRTGLTMVIELETMRLGVQGKVLLWRTLLSASAHEPRLESDQLERLLRRAEDQVRTLDSLHARATATLLSATPPKMAAGAAS
ncbi:hypothetical protein ABZZ79_05520 [Streptomyces sp. NPDC006458]|uniref:hypothetical protein n=1 Tax=Streptomyces sp. NPDC006458 TaxID=3154302 RepID=UPI0033BD9BD4